MINAEGDAEYNAPFAVGATPSRANYNGDKAITSQPLPPSPSPSRRTRRTFALYDAAQPPSNDLISGPANRRSSMSRSQTTRKTRSHRHRPLYPVPVAAANRHCHASGYALAYSGTDAEFRVDPTTAQAGRRAWPTSFPGKHRYGNYNQSRSLQRRRKLQLVTGVVEHNGQHSRC